MAQVVAGTTGIANLDINSLQLIINNVRARLLSNKTVRAQDVKDLIYIYNTWINHNHAVTDYYWQAYGNTSPYGTTAVTRYSDKAINSGQGLANTNAEFVTPGTFNFNIPTQVPSFNALFIAGGGGGGGSVDSGTTAAGGGGAGGWGYLDLAVIPNVNTITVHVGTGGGGGSLSFGNAGTESAIVYNGVRYSAGGGQGGKNSYGGWVGGAGGAAGINGNIGNSGANVTSSSGGNGGNSRYSDLYGVTTGGQGGIYRSVWNGNGGIYGGGGGGGSGTHDGRLMGNGGNGGNGYVAIKTTIPGFVIANFPNIDQNKTISTDVIGNLASFINLIKRHSHLIVDNWY